FDAPSEHEIVVGARKLVGSAQWRKGGGLLQHGSILVRDDQGLIASVMKSPIETPPAASLYEALQRDPSVAEVGDAILASLRRVVVGSVEPFDPVATADAAASLRRTYVDDTWTWRR